MTLENRLADFALAPVQGADALAMMRLSLFDWAACGLAAQDEPVARILHRKALSEGGAPEASLFSGGKVPARAAALTNGAISHALDYDDTHFAHIGHTSVAVIPAALAMAERQGAGLDAMIEAALVGSEAAVRVGLWLGRGHYQIGFHQTATSGAFGATLAAGRLAGLAASGVVTALGIAATRASGLKGQFGTMGKPYNAGLASETGVEATLLAAAGLTSSPIGLSGPQGFGATHAGEAEADAFEALGTRWRFETVSHKLHACCHGLHAMIEALGGLNLQGKDVASVEIRTHPRWLTVCNIATPTSGLEAKFSYRTVAAMVLQGLDTAAIGNFSDPISQRADLVALGQRVTVIGDPALHEMEAEVLATLRDGQQSRATHDLDRPLSLASREAKLLRKAEGLLGKPRAATLLAATKGRDLQALLSQLTTG